MDDQDKRNIFTAFKFPDPDVTRLDQLLPQYGTRSNAAREVILAQLGVEDVARRAAPRRSSGNPKRQRVKEGKAPVITIAISPREAAALDQHRGEESRSAAARDLLRQGLSKEAKR